MDQEKENLKLAYQLTYHRYLMNKDKAQNLFTELNVPEYIALHSIARVTSDQDGASSRTYLSDLAQHMEMPLYLVSDMVGKLKDRGLVLWSHSGNGCDGTYVSITEAGMGAMHRQEERLADYYSRVAEKFGLDNLLRLLEQMAALEKTMDETFAEKGGVYCGSDPVG